MATLFEQSLQRLRARSTKTSASKFTFVYFGDSWVGPVLGPDKAHPTFKATGNFVVEEAIRKAVTFDPLFILHGGDAVFSGTPTQLHTFRNLVRDTLAVTNNSDVPFFVTPGNHDATFVAGQQNLTNFRNIIGRVHYTLDLPKQNFRLVAVNDITRTSSGAYSISDDELRFLQNRISGPRKYKFVSMHVPPKVGAFKTEFKDPDSTLNAGNGLNRLLRVVRQNHVDGVLASHVHGFFRTKVDGTQYVVSGGGGAILVTGQVQHIVVVTVDHGTITYKKVPIGWTA